VAISDAVKDSLVGGVGPKADRVVRIYNGVEPFSGPALPSLRHELGLDPGVVLVGAVGQIARWKGQRVLLDAIERLPSVHLAIVGEVLFPENEASYSAALDRRIEQAGLAARVHRVGPRSDIPAVMASLDLLAHVPVEPEPFGRVLVEAMLCGVPVVASRIGAIPEVITLECGLLVPPGDPVALAGAIERLVAYPARGREMGKRGRERAMANFSLDATRRQVETLYRGVLGG
jgi:glycosyltransferase involved in cell wall biosynthesis